MIQEFIIKIYPIAKVMEVATGIPWQFAMVQSAHESRYGRSLLTVEANNLFGLTGGSWIKLGRPLYRITTKEHSPKPPEHWNEPGRFFESEGDIQSVEADGRGGSWLMVGRPFRKYPSWQDSMNDWANLISRHYPAAIAAARRQDFVGFAKAMHQGGFATDPDYAVKLVRLNQLVQEDLAIVARAGLPIQPRSEAPPENA